MSQCLREQSRQSQYSPCVVADEEWIVYVLLDPPLWKNGDLVAGAFSKSRLDAGDLSVCRAAYSSAEDAYKNIVEPQLARHQGEWTLVGAFRALCRDIRGLFTDHPPVRVVCVVDDGLEAFPAHAHLAYSDATRAKGFWNNRNQRQAVRANLIQVFRANGGPHTLEDCFR